MNQLCMQAAALMTPAEITTLRQHMDGTQKNGASTTAGKTRRRRNNGQTQDTVEAPTTADGTSVPESAPAVTTPVASAPVTAVADTSDQPQKRKPHDWPDVGVELAAEYFGVTYRATVIPARKKLLSGRQLKITTGSAAGEVCDSLSEAMIVATAEQRRKQGLRRKGVANGWDFWQWVGK